MKEGICSWFFVSMYLEMGKCGAAAALPVLIFHSCANFWFCHAFSFAFFVHFWQFCSFLHDFEHFSGLMFCQCYFVSFYHLCEFSISRAFSKYYLAEEAWRVRWWKMTFWKTYFEENGKIQMLFLNIFLVNFIKEQ